MLLRNSKVNMTFKLAAGRFNSFMTKKQDLNSATGEIQLLQSSGL